MVATSQLLDEYTIETVLVDKSSAGADQAAAALERLEAIAQASAAAVRDAGDASGETGAKITAAATAFDKIANRVDDVTRAHNQLTRAQEALRAGQEAANREIQAGGADMDQVNRTLAALAQRVSTASEKLGEARAVAEANALATQAWNGAVGQGASAIQTWSAQIALGAQSSRAASDATRDAAAAQAEFNRVLAVNTSGTGFKDAAASAADMGAELDRLRAKVDPAFAASKQYEAELREIDAAQKVGAISAAGAAAATERATAAFASANAALSGQIATERQAADAERVHAASIKASGDALQGLVDKYAPLAAVERAQAQEQREINALFASGNLTATEHAAALTKSTASYKQVAEGAGAASAAQRGMAIQFIQGASGIASGQPVLTTFIQQGHQVVDQSLAMGQGFGGIAKAAGGLVAALLGPVGIAVAVVGALVAMGLAAENQGNKLADLRQSLRLTHDDYATLADSVEASAKRVAASSSLSKSAAEAIGTSIASSRYLGAFAGDLDALTKSAADYARVAGVDGPAAGKLFREAIDSPAAAAAALASQGLPAMDAALLRVIQRLEASGQSGAATKLVLEAIGKGSKGAADDLTPLGAAMKNLHEAFSTVGQDGKSFATNVGDIIDAAVSKGVNALASLVRSLKEARDYAQNVNKGQGEMTPQSYGADQAAAQNGAIGAVQGTALAKADPSIQAALRAAADRERIDVELLARLQVYENAAVQKDGTWARAGNYPDSATGPMQVKPSTFGGIAGFAGQDVNNPTVNIAAGAKYFAGLLNKYGDVKLAVLAYHDGEGAVDDILAGRRSASVAGSKEANTVTSGYLGTGIVTSNATAIAPSSAVTGQGDNQTQAPFGQALTIAQINKLSGGSILPESAQQALKDGYSGTQLHSQEDAADAVTKLSKALADLSASGTTTGPVVNQLNALLEKAKGEAYGAVDATTALHRAATDSLVPLQQQAGAQRTVAEAIQAAKSQLESQGKALSNTAAAQIQTDVLTKLSAGFNDLVAATDRSTAANDRISGSIDKSAPSLIAATNQEKALAAARDAYLPGPAQEAAVARYTAALNRQTASSADLASVQKSFDQRDQLQVLAAETASLGQNEDLRTKEIALLQAKQALVKSGADLDSAASKANLANVAAIADASANFAHQKANLDELSGFFDNTFNTIANSITSAMATGEISMAKLEDVGKAVVSALVSEFAKLALLNPLKDALFGTTSPGLGGVVGALLGTGGGASLFTGAAAAGSGIANALSSSKSSFDGGGVTVDGSGNILSGSGGTSLSGVTSLGGAALKGADFLSGGKLLQSAKDYVFKAVGFTPGQSLGSWVSELIGEVPAGTSAAVAASTANAAAQAGFESAGAIVDATGNVIGVAGQGAAGAAGAVGSAGTSAILDGAGAVVDAAGNVVGTAATATSAAADAASASGIAVSELTATTGVVGASVNAVLEAVPYIGAAVSIVTDLVTGNYRGAAIVATTTAVGAIVGSIVPGIGTAIGAGIGATVGVLYDTFFPAHKKNPYQDTEVDVVDGRLQRGKQVNQLEKLDAASAQVAAFADGLNSYMDAVGIKLSNANGILGHVGNGIKGLTQVDDVSKLFGDLRFDTDPNAKDASTNFGIARHALVDTSFATPDALNAELVKIAAFADAMDALGVHLQGVGKDLTGISIASVDLTDAIGQGSDLRTALEHDLPGQTFANVDALSAEIEKVNQFVNGTMQGLMHPVLVSTSAFIDALAANHKRYDDAIAQAVAYGLDTTGLQAGRQAADELLYAPQRKALDQADATTQNNTIIAGPGNPGDKFVATFNNSAIANDQQRDALVKSMTDVYGDAVRSTQFFYDRLSVFDAQFAAQVAASVRAFERQQTTNGLALMAQFASLDARKYTLQGDQQAADLANFDAKAAQEKDAFGNSMADYYGEAYRQSADYQLRMTELETVQQGERLQIVQKYGTATSTALSDALKQAQTNVGTLFTSLTAYADKLKTGSDSPLSVTDQYALASSKFNAVAGAAAAGDYNSANQLQGYSDTLLAASRAVNGSGTGYGVDFQRVLNAIDSVSTQSDNLTLSSQREIMATVVDRNDAAIADLRDTLKAELTAVRRELQQQARAA